MMHTSPRSNFFLLLILFIFLVLGACNNAKKPKGMISDSVIKTQCDEFSKKSIVSKKAQYPVSYIGFSENHIYYSKNDNEKIYNSKYFRYNIENQLEEEISWDPSFVGANGFSLHLGSELITIFDIDGNKINEITQADLFDTSRFRFETVMGCLLNQNELIIVLKALDGSNDRICRVDLNSNEIVASQDIQSATPSKHEILFTTTNLDLAVYSARLNFQKYDKVAELDITKDEDEILENLFKNDKYLYYALGTPHISMDGLHRYDLENGSEDLIIESNSDLRVYGNRIIYGLRKVKWNALFVEDGNMLYSFENVLICDTSDQKVIFYDKYGNLCLGTR